MRVHLGYGRDDWEALPWFLQRLYLEELAEDGKLVGVSDDEDALDDLEAGGVTVVRG